MSVPIICFFFWMQQKEKYFVIRFTRTLSLRFFFFCIKTKAQIRCKLTFVVVGIITIPIKTAQVPNNNSLMETIFIRKQNKKLLCDYEIMTAESQFLFIYYFGFDVHHF